MTRITTAFGRESTAAEVAHGIDLTGRRVVVTGAASGIGVETARALAGAGADVTLAVRNVEAGEQTARDIVASTGNTPCACAISTSPTAPRSRRSSPTGAAPLHVLVNNAGVMASPPSARREGWELQFATNHLGHFALALGLHDALAAAGDARIVAVSSSAHRLSPVVFDDIHFDAPRPYEPWAAYGQSKTANVLFAVEATRRWAGDGITANALMPGGDPHEPAAPRRGRRGDKGTLGRGSSARASSGRRPSRAPRRPSCSRPPPRSTGIGGRYFEDCNEAAVNDDEDTVVRTGVRSYALDPEAAARLWDASLAMLAQPVAATR